MTILEVTPVIETETTDDPDVWHRLCCDNRKKTLCGAPRESDEMIEMPESQTGTDCIMCDIVWDTTDLCPQIKKCPHPTRNRGFGED